MTKTDMTTTPNQSARAKEPAGYARLALHVLKQAFVDVSNRRRVNIEDLRPWAFIAGISQRSLEESFRQCAGMRRRGHCHETPLSVCGGSCGLQAVETAPALEEHRHYCSTCRSYWDHEDGRCANLGRTMICDDCALRLLGGQARLSDSYSPALCNS